MLLILHNLPKNVTALDVRRLIQEQCGFREVILDNLLDEGPGKRITVGLAEEEDAAILLRKLNGLHYKKCQLYVEDVRKKKLSAPSYPVLIPSGLQPQVPRPWLIANVPPIAPPPQVNNSNMPYYMTQNNNSNNMNYGKQTQTTQLDSSIFTRHYNNKPNEMLQTLKANNFLTYPLASNPNTNQASDAPPSFKTYQIDRDKQGNRRDNTTHSNWRENKSPPSKRHENFGNFSQRESRFGDKSFEWNKSTEVSRRSRDVDRSPPRGRNSFRGNQKQDRRDDSPRRSRSRRSNPRDKEAYKYERRSGREQNSLFGRQKDNVFDQHERRNVQKRNYEQVGRIDRDDERPKRSFGNEFGTSTTFSSKPENSFITKPNRSIFNKVMEPRVFKETSNKVQFSSPKQDTFKSQNNFPLLKRARFDPPQHFGNKKYVNPNAPANKATELQKMMTRHTNWRTQSATLLAKEVLKNASTSKIENPTFKTVLKKLRECIMSRIDVIMGDKIATNLDEMLNGYRTKFNNRDDINFFKGVMEKVERENEEKADEITGPNIGNEKQQQQESGKFNKGPSVVNQYYSPRPNVTQLKQQQQYSGKFNKGPNVVNPFYSPRPQLVMKPNFGANGKQKGLISQNRPKMPFIKDPKTMPKLPKYPNSDKQEYRQFQKNALLEHEEGFYTMEPETERAVNEEVEQLFECYVEACEPSTNKDENHIRNKIVQSSADEFKKIIKLNLTKRVLNVTDGLALRIFSTPKPPPIAALNEFLKKHGAISLKKSETKRMFIATFDSYESYDRLIVAQTASFGSVTIHMKPFHVLGPTVKKNYKGKQTIANAEDVKDFTKDELEIDLTDDINDDADVMLVENEDSEVVVIKDDLDKSINYGSDANNDDVQEINDLKELSNDKVDSNIEVSVSNEKANNSDTQVNTSIAIIEDSRNIVHNSQNDLNKSETDVLESLDDIFNEVDEILEDDLEDF